MLRDVGRRRAIRCTRRLKRKPPEEKGSYVRCMQNQALMELGAALE